MRKSIILIFVIFVITSHWNVSFLVEVLSDDKFYKSTFNITETFLSFGYFVSDLDGNYYIADKDTNEVNRINMDGSIDTWSNSDIVSPRGIAVDSDGNIYITNNELEGPARVVRINLNGTPNNLVDDTYDKWSVDLFQITGIDIDNSGNIYLSGVNPIDAHGVTRINTQGTFDNSDDTIDYFGDQWTGDIVIDDNGYVYTVDFPKKLRRFNPLDETLIEMMTVPSVSPNNLLNIDEEGDIYCSNISDNKIYRIIDGTNTSIIEFDYSIIDGFYDIYGDYAFFNGMSKVIFSGSDISYFVADEVITISNNEILPEIVLSNPGNNDIDVSTDNEILVYFNENVEISDENLIILSGNLVDVLISTSVSGSTITIIPIDSLDAESIYTLSIQGDSIKDLAGNFLQGDYNISFETEKAVKFSLSSDAEAGLNIDDSFNVVVNIDIPHISENFDTKVVETGIEILYDKNYLQYVSGLEGNAPGINPVDYTIIDNDDGVIHIDFLGDGITGDGIFYTLEFLLTSRPLGDQSIISSEIGSLPDGTPRDFSNNLLEVIMIPEGGIVINVNPEINSSKSSSSSKKSKNKSSQSNEDSEVEEIDYSLEKKIEKEEIEKILDNLDIYDRIPEMKKHNLILKIDEENTEESYVRIIEDSIVKIKFESPRKESESISVYIKMNTEEFSKENEELYLLQYNTDEKSKFLVKVKNVFYKNGKVRYKFDDDGIYGLAVKISEEDSNYIKEKYSKSYISGYPQGDFRPDSYITRGEVANIFAKFLSDKGGEKYPPRYTDVYDEYWASGSIKKVSRHGLFLGYNDRSFRPDNYITRQEYAVIVSKYLKSHNREIKEVSAPFSDIDVWGKDSIDILYNSGIIAGYSDNTFKPNQYITRAEAVIIINNLIFMPEAKKYPLRFTDVPYSHWAYKHINNASQSYYYRHNLSGEFFINRVSD